MEEGVATLLIKVAIQTSHIQAMKETREVMRVLLVELSPQYQVESEDWSLVWALLCPLD
jgi:hypothetical protein